MISSNSLFTEEQLETLWNLALQGRSQNHVFDSFENKTGEVSQLHLNSDPVQTDSYICDIQNPDNFESHIHNQEHKIWPANLIKTVSEIQKFLIVNAP